MQTINLQPHNFNLPVTVRDGVEVMSSMDLAKLCGQSHSDFKKKIKKVLGDAGKFSGIFFDQYNREQEGYYLPERESCLMAMSYSYELQAKVYDRWKALEEGKEQPTQPVSIFTDLAKITEDKKALAELFGLSGNQALLSAAKATETLTGHNPIKLLGVELKADRKEKTYTVTELGREFFDGMSAQKLNRRFEAAKLQNRVAGQWELTEKGKGHAEILDTGKKRSNGTPVKQIKWFKTVGEVV